jgi:uncharacterized protein (UPF0276 family)
MTMIQTAGISLKPPHYEEAQACLADGLWFEVHPENYFVDGGPRLAWLDAIRANHALSLHGVALSLAADCPPDPVHLRRFRTLVDRVEPALVSEHLAWSAWRGAYHPDLLPFPRTAESLSRIAENISIAQEALGRQIAIENPSHYVHVQEHTWDEIDFLTELSRRTGCGLLLDVNNVHVAANNLGYSAEHYIDRFPSEAIMEIHLAGHTPDPNLGNALLIDSHDASISPAVWSLYERLADRIGPRPTLIERDDNLPRFEDLLTERNQAHGILTASRAKAA